MFDDFMHNDFPDLNLNHAQQDAMLHAQNRAMEQAARAQVEAAANQTETQSQMTETMPLAGASDAATHSNLLLQVALKRLFQLGNGVLHIE